MKQCLDAEPGAWGVLCADNHLGYSMPIGGVVAYRDHVSPSAVGFDIGCGNLAIRTDMDCPSVADTERIMDDIVRTTSFGVGRANNVRVDHPILDTIAKSPLPFQRGLVDLAAKQLGTVGSGNHYVDLFTDRFNKVWIGVHFGSRGFGHKTATWALAQAGTAHGDAMMAPPTLIPASSDLGQDYIAAMRLAGEYAYAGREWVVERVRQILGARMTDRVHNHHNFAWREEHSGGLWWVHRKGATPAKPGERGFVGSSMLDPAVILYGNHTPTARAALFSTVHGAGRRLSRRVARREIDYTLVRRLAAARGVALRGGGADEAPEAYKELDQVLTAHGDTVTVETQLLPIGVAMAGPDIVDPYKD